MESFSSRTELLVGEQGLQALNNAVVVVCGLGGVGSFAAEALARSGIGKLILVDFDTVSVSNINRQLPALHSTVGQAKADVVAARIADINPACQIEIKKDFLDADNVEDIVGTPCFVVDAIDYVPGKISLIVYCKEKNIPIVASMGTGNKVAPEKMEIADISKTEVCPLARNIRKQLKLKGITQGVTVVYSKELPIKQIATGREKPVIGSVAFVPSVSGLLLASVVVRTLCGIEIK